MISLESDVSEVAGIGPQYQKLLGKLEISSVKDLVYHFPFRYNDFSQIRKITEILPGEQVTILAKLDAIKNIYSKQRKKLTKGAISDATGVLDVLWFNQFYLVRNLKAGETYFFSGKVDVFTNKVCLISPEVEESSSENVSTGRLVPIYTETKGVSSKWLRKKIHRALNASIPFSEFLPEKFGLTPFAKALKQIHFPDSEVLANEARNRFAFEELFIDLLKVERRKDLWSKELKAYHLSARKKDIDRLIDSLPFRLTTDQKLALKEILADLTKKRPMNRLLEGDVGTGKTIVSLIAAYLVTLNNKKVLYLAPTEILARQQFETFSTILTPLGTTVGMKLRGLTSAVSSPLPAGRSFLAEQNPPKSASGGRRRIKTGGKKQKTVHCAVVVGTHALLYDQSPPEDVALVVIDEQHRFGVEQRAKLAETTRNKPVPHILTMTATPIPRTLALTLYGDLDISILREPPHKEKKITTWVLPEKKRVGAYDWVKEKGEQTFVVCPFIEESANALFENVKAAQKHFDQLKEGVFKDVEVGLLHGRMRPAEKQVVLERFRKKEIMVLVSTPVIEVGVDVPEATIMVIESAERYGLASLHQLRGRVGRGKSEAYCLLFPSNYSKFSVQRLKNLETLHTGIELAEIDMKLRGGGDVYGTDQHGFKTFKLADPSNLRMLEDAKTKAQTTYQNIASYPALKEKLLQETCATIARN